MSGGSFESSQRTEPVCASRFSSIKNCFKTRASGLARGRGWSRIGHSGGVRVTISLGTFSPDWYTE